MDEQSHQLMEHGTPPTLIAEFRRRLLDFRGTAGRLEFVFYSQLLPLGLLVTMTALVIIIAPDATAQDPISTIGAIVWIAIAFPVAFAAGARRLHDLGRPAWLVIGAVVPCVNLALLSILILTPGRKPSIR